MLLAGVSEELTHTSLGLQASPKSSPTHLWVVGNVGREVWVGWCRHGCGLLHSGPLINRVLYGFQPSFRPFCFCFSYLHEIDSAPALHMKKRKIKSSDINLVRLEIKYISQCHSFVKFDQLYIWKNRQWQYQININSWFSWYFTCLIFFYKFGLTKFDLKTKAIC